MRNFTNHFDIRTKICSAFCVLALSWVATDGAQGADTLVLLDGSTLSATISSIDLKGNLVGEGIPVGLQVDGLRQVTTPITASGPAENDAAIRVEMVGGGALSLSKFSIDKDQNCHLKNLVLGSIAVPIDSLKAVRFRSGPINASFSKAMDEMKDEDRVYVKLGGGLEPLSGLIEYVDDSNVVIDLENGMRTIDIDKVYGIVFAFVERPPSHNGECLLALSDNSTLWGRVKSLKDGKLNLTSVGDTDISLPWNAVKSMKVRSTRLVFLTDLEPISARHQPLVTLQRPWQSDRSVAGRPLQLSGKVFDRGIGVASHSVLQFANEGDFDLLAAVIGIDDETDNRGDCIFVVEVDGQEKFRQRVTGKDEPRAISVDIRGAQTISLIVESGEGLDLADHADWCDVRLVQE